MLFMYSSQHFNCATMNIKEGKGRECECVCDRQREQEREREREREIEREGKNDLLEDTQVGNQT